MAAVEIQKDTVVTLAYKLSVVNPDEGLVVVDEKSESDPIEFLFGYNALLPAIESHLLGQSVDFELSIKLPPEEAYGDFSPELEIWYDRDKLPATPPIAVGMKYQTQGAHGQVIAVVVKEIDGDNVLLDGNHPLAGHTVSFDIKVLGVRKAKPEEISSGQITPSRLH